MKTKVLPYLLIIVLSISSSCKKENETNSAFEKRALKADYAAAALPVQTVSGNITVNTTWDNSKVWELNGVVSVVPGVTLTIAPGTYIKSTVNTAGVQNGVLVIRMGAKINASGTATDPIVFTSRHLLDGITNNPINSGDFGGLILLGKAHVNTGTGSVSGLPLLPEFIYGGTDDTDNSGTLQYVRIEYPGFILSPNLEINGLLLGGVGNTTTLDHIEVRYPVNDSFTFFGGSVNASYLISIGAFDDGFDFDLGYNGAIDYAVVMADANTGHSQSGPNSDSHGIESDNNPPAASASFNLTPKTHPILSNFSIIGTSAVNNGYRYGVRNRRGAEIELYKSVITGYPSGFVFNDGTESFYTANVSKLTENDFHGFTAAISPAGTYPGNTFSTIATAPPYGMLQPFYNNGPLSFTGAANGAFSLGTAWISGWSSL